MSSRYRSAAPIIAIYTGPVMKLGGGRNSASSPKSLLTNYGLPVTLNARWVLRPLRINYDDAFAPTWTDTFYARRNALANFTRTLPNHHLWQRGVALSGKALSGEVAARDANFMYVDDLTDALIFLLKHYSGEEHVNIGTVQSHLE